jgi:Tfp pilus assembly protein PilF
MGHISAAIAGLALLGALAGGGAATATVAGAAERTPGVRDGAAPGATPAPGGASGVVGTPGTGMTQAGPAGPGSTPATLADLATQSGIQRLLRGDTPGAIDTLRFALEGNPNNPVALTALGDAYLKTDHQDLAALAVDAYTRAVTLDPANVHAREGAARTAWLLGRHDEALEQMETLYWAGGQVRDRYASELASYFMLSGQLDRGLALFARALPRARERHATMLLMATLLMQKQDKATARLFVQRVLAEAPAGSPMARQAQRMMAEGVAER